MYKLLEYPYPKTLSLSPKCLMNCLPVQEGRAERGGDRRHVAALSVTLAVALVRRVPVQRLQALLATQVIFWSFHLINQIGLFREMPLIF